MSKREREQEKNDGGRFKYFKKSHEEEMLPDLFSVFKGEVAELKPYGAFIKIPGLSRKQGLVHKSQISKARVDDPSEILSRGELVYCKVIGLEDNKISLSMKVVNQTNGMDEDTANVQISLDAQKRKQMGRGSRPKIEIGAELDTDCKKCGGHGHLAQDCFHVKGGKTYDLVDDVDLDALASTTQTPETKKHKSKKKKEKKKKVKKHKHSSSSDTDDSSNGKKTKKTKHKKKKKKHKRHRSSSSSSG